MTTSTSLGAFVGTPIGSGGLLQKRGIAHGSFCAIRPILPHRRVNRVSKKPVQMGLIPLIPNWVALSGWIFGAYRFYRGFNKTSYQSSFRLPLAVVWPVLFVFNGSFRQNFMKSIGGSDD